MHTVAVSLPRSAFSPREVARAGDVWRLFQDVAVGGSIAAGWPPERYVEEGVSFIVRSMTVVHQREPRYGEPIEGTTWPSRFRRGMFFRRECRLASPAGPVAAATQEWVHVTAELALARASDALTDAFEVEEHDPPVALPAFEREEGAAEHVFGLTCWHTWMDPLGHVNHPAYVDWCDEGLSRAMAEAGLDPVRLSPVAEEVTFKAGVRAGDEARVITKRVGRTAEGAAVFEHRVETDRPCARALTIRRLAGEDGPSALLSL